MPATCASRRAASRPSFSIDDREGGEWNTEALGPTKRLLSVELMDKLRRKYGEGGLLHFGQGKWYPGEQLPRWSLNLFWRKDGEPIWTDPALFADEHDDLGATTETAAAFLRLLARRLGVDRDPRLSGVRGSVVVPLARAQAPEQRESIRRARRRSAGADAPEARVRARLRQAGRPCAGAGAR
jgi:uncharacterized protein (DUF2126 family)